MELVDMVILELYLENFGKFFRKKMVLKEGINLFYGENETGKTTIHTFIKGMLFNIEKQRGRVSKNDMYSLYEPWENPGYYAGRLRFLSGGKVFRLERNFQKNQKKSVLVCETDGEELSIEHGDLDYLLEGLNEVNYRNTVSIGQLKAETDSGLTVQLENYMANYQETGDVDVDVSAAVAILQAQKKELEKKEKVLTEEQNKESLLLRNKKEYLECNFGKKEQEKADNHAKQQVLKVEYKRLSADKERQVRKEEAGKNKNHTGYADAFILIIGIILCVVWFLAVPVWYVKGIGIAVGGILFWLFYKRNSRKRNSQIITGSQRDKPSDSETEMLLRRKKTVGLEMQKLSWLIEKLDAEMLELNTEINNIEENLQEQKVLSEEQLYIREQRGAINKAYETIVRLSGEIHKEKGNKLNELASSILSAITDGTYNQIRIDDKTNVFINTPDKLVRLEQVSRGTLEQIYFSLRMASAKLFFGDENMPIILDDTFAMYDEERLKNTLRWLAKSQSQVIIFTCHKREEMLLNELQIPFHMIDA